MGTGINTDSQLGYHEFPRNSGIHSFYKFIPPTNEIMVGYAGVLDGRLGSCA